MTTLLHNLLDYSLQIGAMVAASALLLTLLRIRTPAVKLVWLQSVLVLCLSIPLLQQWKASPGARYEFGGLTATRAAIVEQLASAAAVQRLPSISVASALSLIVPLILGGIAARILWISLGFWSLHRYRRAARPWTSHLSGLDTFLTQTRVKAEIALSDRISGPVTFGVRQPLVLLPAYFDDMNPETQEAILRHELNHVRRKDWVFTVIEEMVLAVLWFHPAAWWLVYQIRLAREQMIDLEVIQTTGSQGVYLEALLEAARASRPARLVPATSFLWRGHLVQRVAAIVQSAHAMSRRRLVSSTGIALAGVLLAARLAVISFPLSSQAQSRQPSGDAIAVETGGDHLLHRAGMEYPGEAIEKNVEGLVVVDVDVNTDGAVSDARVISGPLELRRLVLQSVLDWRYDPKTQPAGPTQVAFRFRLPAPGQQGPSFLAEFPSRSETTGAANTVYFRKKESPGVMAEVGPLMENAEKASRGELTGTLVRIQTHGTAESPVIANGLPVHLGDKVTAESIKRLAEYLHAADSKLSFGLDAGPSGDITLHVFSEVGVDANREKSR